MDCKTCGALAMFSRAGAEKGALEKFQWGSSAFSASVTVFGLGDLLVGHVGIKFCTEDEKRERGCFTTKPV